MSGMLMISVGLLFLWNPCVNVIDILPDFIGWLLVAIGLQKFSMVYEPVRQATKRAWILLGISLAKLLPMYWSLCGESVYPTAAEPTMILTDTAVFALFEVPLAISVFFAYTDCLISRGRRFDSYAVFRRVGAVKFLTASFFIHRAVCSILPELVYLRSTEYLGNVVYGVVIDIRRFRPYLIVFFSFIAGVWGLLWLISALRYLSRVRREREFREGSARALLEDAGEIAIYRAELTRRVAQTLLSVGAIFFCSLTFENIAILPDAIGVVCFSLALIYLKKQERLTARMLSVPMLAGLVTACYAVFRTVCTLQYHEIWSYSVTQFLRGEMELTAEKQTQLRLQYLYLIPAVAETVCVILFVLWVLRRMTVLKNGERTPLDGNARACFVGFVISASFEVIGTLPVFTFLVTPITVFRACANLLFLYLFYRFSTPYFV